MCVCVCVCMSVCVCVCVCGGGGVAPPNKTCVTGLVIEPWPYVRCAQRVASVVSNHTVTVKMLASLLRPASRLTLASSANLTVAAGRHRSLMGSCRNKQPFIVLCCVVLHCVGPITWPRFSPICSYYGMEGHGVVWCGVCLVNHTLKIRVLFLPCNIVTTMLLFCCCRAPYHL